MKSIRKVDKCGYLRNQGIPQSHFFEKEGMKGRIFSTGSNETAQKESRQPVRSGPGCKIVPCSRDYLAIQDPAIAFESAFSDP
jgi:hypothetical protein